MHRFRMQPHNLGFTSAPPSYILPTVAHGPSPRFFNHVNHMRPTPRWPTSLRPNGTYLSLPPPSSYRGGSRATLPNNLLRSSIAARSIAGQHQQQAVHSRPNSKYTANTPNSITRSIPMSIANVGDSSPANSNKEMLGERLYNHIGKWYPEMAGKITGMLLEIDNSELVSMMEDPDSLKAKVEEAVAVLEAHHSKIKTGNQ